MNIKRPLIALVTVIILAILSVLVLKLPSDEKKGLNSSELTEQVTETPTATGSVKRTDYVNADGKITMAQDKWYASCVRTLDEKGRVTQECYYDENGAPTAMYAGYCGIDREYDADGRNFKYTFLDENCKPMECKYGYASVVRYFDADGRLSEEWYYDLQMQQVSVMGYYGSRYQLDSEGRSSEVTYLDKEGNVTSCDTGYAIIRYTRDSEGKLLKAMYFDEEGAPKPLEKGQYGVRYKDDGTTAMLNINGEEIISLNTFLAAHHWIVFAVGGLLTLGVVLIPARRRWHVAFVLVYSLFIAYETLYRNASASGVMRIHWFESMIHAVEDPVARGQLVDNIWLFVPYGCGLYRLLKMRWSIVVVVATTVVIELVQLVTLLGYCEIDDVVCNSLGGIMGVVFAWALASIMSEKFAKNK